MYTIELLNQNVSVYKKAIESDYTYYTSSLIDFITTTANRNRCKIDYLRQLNKKDPKAANKYKKENLPCMTVSATFPYRRVSGEVGVKTGIIAIDIDKDKNPALDVEKAKQDVMRMPSVFLSSLSCRGEGIYCFIYYNKLNYIGYVFNALRRDFMQMGYYIDDSCKDITRLRYVSYDDNILVKQGDIQCYEDMVKDQEREAYECDDEWIMNKDDVKDIAVCVHVLVNHMNYTADDYNEWLLDGFRLATLPNKEVGLRLFEMISQNSDNYEGPDDVEEKFDECCRTTTYRTNILGYYINKVKAMYGRDWRFRINDLLKQKIY